VLFKSAHARVRARASKQTAIGSRRSPKTEWARYVGMVEELSTAYAQCSVIS